MGQELAETYGQINCGAGVLIVHVTPTNVRGYKDVTGQYLQPAQPQGPLR